MIRSDLSLNYISRRKKFNECVMQNSVLKIIAGLLFANNVTAVEPDWHDYNELLTSVTQGEKHGTPLSLVDYGYLKKSGLIDKVY